MRAAEIASNRLRFARKSKSDFSTHNLDERIDQTVDPAGSDHDLKKNYDFRQVEIVREYAAGATPMLGESRKIQRVRLNLLRNGAKAIQERMVVSFRYGRRPQLDGSPGPVA